ncbi:MAG TPA: undecaprenyldiphospho-muramoylpentapeptide beta-N-acetylglucosaminyltransferase [Syntrophales bacterium]|nr:undecaprenyldiphospho-muramoylpentapeptide beta-N-acetylglucosaminyltransferase [Syntrophales bacterium]
MIIAGGGTGGHLFPGVAVAEAFMNLDRLHEVLFVGTERGLEKRVLPELGYPLATLDVEGIKGRSWGNSLQAALKIPKSMMQAFKIMKKFSPHVVLGVGGYASGPAVLTAHFLGIRTAIAEQNAIPGVTNRILANFVDRIFLSFPDPDGEFPARKSVVAGNPIRASFVAAAADHQQQQREREDIIFDILVFGGSQGAHAVNMAVLDAAALLGELREKIRIVHQTGAKDVPEVRAGYEKLEITAAVHPFIMDMATAYREADLLICRAGATSVAEITAMGKAAILIPFPFAIHDHQTKNAEVLVRAEAALMIPERELTGAKLAAAIRELAADPERIARMSARSRSLGRPEAAAEIAAACVAMAERRGLH